MRLSLTYGEVKLLFDLISVGLSCDGEDRCSSLAPSSLLILVERIGQCLQATVWQHLHKNCNKIVMLSCDKLLAISWPISDNLAVCTSILSELYMCMCQLETLTNLANLNKFAKV